MSLFSKLPPNEIAMQQVWRNRLWLSDRAVTVDGQELLIVNPGILNNTAGPDFSAARIVIDGQLWVGSVELHVRASDWHRHGHDGDDAYANVVLHVVGLDDAIIYRPDGSVIPQMVMKIDREFVDRFNHLLHEPHLVLPTCGSVLKDIASVFKLDWITALAFERLQRKSDDIGVRLKSTAGDWYQTVFITLARGLGFGVNTDNMERLARSLPFRVVLKHIDSVRTIEALLFGQASLINFDSPADEYEAVLGREYKFYAVKYGLQPIERPVWQLSSRNGVNTPQRRIALLAKVASVHALLLGIRICETVDADISRRVFDVELSPYWRTHSMFGRCLANGNVSALGRQSADLMMINVFVPLMYHRGEQTGRDDLMDAAVSMLESIKPENNAITRGFADFDVVAKDAFMSQALVQLHREYCERRRCFECRLGHRMLAGCVSLRPQL